MSNTKNQTVNMIVVLGVVAALSGLILTVFYGWINPIVENRRQSQVIDLGLRAIFPDASTFHPIELHNIPGIESPVYEVYNSPGERLGYFYHAEGEGWSHFKIAVGVDDETMSVVGVRVLEHEETPGLGSAIEEDWFLDQFQGKSLSDAFHPGADVDMISGATVSTRGMAEAVSSSARLVLGEFGVAVDVVSETPAVPPAETTAPAPRSIYERAMLRLTDEDVGDIVPSKTWNIIGPSNEWIGIGFLTSGDGFGGPVEVVTVIDPDSLTVIGVEVVRHNETPTLGDQIAEPFFLDQFKGKAVVDASTLDDDIDGITMATQSSRSVADAVSRAIFAADVLFGQGGDGQ